MGDVKTEPDPSPFLSYFLEQVESLYSAFTNLPTDEHEAALSHVHNLVDRLNWLERSTWTSTHAAHGSYDRDTSEHYSSGHDSNTDKTTFNMAVSSQAKGRRRKIATPRRSSELYDNEGGGEEDIEGRAPAKKLGVSKNAQKVFKEDEEGYRVVTDFKGDKRFRCDQCGLQFTYYAALLRHLDSRHNSVDANQKIQETNKNAVSCDQCGATLSSKGALQAHKLMHAGIQPFHCDVCNKKFSLISNLRRHKRIHEGVKPFQCDICHKKFTEKRSVEVHRRIHTGERPYKCDVCGMKFSQLGSWMGHRDTHKEKEQSQYKCDVCNKSFSQKVGLHNHKKRHQMVNKCHKCTHCDTSFYSPEELRLHILSHTGLKPYLCAECGKSFSRHQTLKNHMKLHNREEKIYSCNWCPETFSSAWAMTRHTSKVHKDSPGIGDTVSEVGGLVEDVIDDEDLAVLPKDVLAVYCTDSGIDNPSSQELLEAISKGQMF